MSRVLVIGGLPSSLVNFRGYLLKAMRERGHQVIACAGGSDAKVTQCLADMGIRYIALTLNRTGTNPLNDLRLIWQLLLIMRRERPEIVFAYTIKPVIYGMLAARLVGIKRRFALITGLGFTFIGDASLKQHLLGKIAAILYRLALSKAATVFFQNNDDLALFHDRGILGKSARTVRVMGSGVDLEHFKPALLPESPPVFLLIARLLTDKGIREYVDAARTVHQKRPEARFALLGPFDENPAAIPREELEAWVKSGVIDYWGETDDVRPFIARCTIYVLPSYREGTPRSVLEAMAMGRPIVTTDAPGCRDTVENGVNGYLARVKDAESLAQMMLKCLAPEADLSKMGQASRQLAERLFDVNAVNRVLLESMEL